MENPHIHSENNGDNCATFQPVKYITKMRFNNKNSGKGKY